MRLLPVVLAAHVACKGKARGSGVGAARRLAGVGALASVRARVRLECATHCCSVPAASHVAGVGPLARVRVHVPLEVAT